ncbi:MAG: hypothetical protein M5U08_01735 [Burkholderiales bacterium]|nr:hypothetical protein [Burkholderiales bacterium]
MFTSGVANAACTGEAVSAPARMRAASSGAARERAAARAVTGSALPWPVPLKNEPLK